MLVCTYYRDRENTIKIKRSLFSNSIHLAFKNSILSDPVNETYDNKSYSYLLRG